MSKWWFKGLRFSRGHREPVSSTAGYLTFLAVHSRSFRRNTGVWGCAIQWSRASGMNWFPRFLVTGNPWLARGRKGSLLYASDLEGENPDRTVIVLASSSTGRVSALSPPSWPVAQSPGRFSCWKGDGQPESTGVWKMALEKLRVQ